jgi:hypothetical protein
LLAASLASHASLASASDPPLGGDGLMYVFGALVLWAVLLVASVILAVRRGLARGARSGWRYLGGALLTLPASILLTSLIEDGRLVEPVAKWALILLPSLVVWLAYVLAIHFDDGREVNRVWKSTR